MITLLKFSSDPWILFSFNVFVLTFYWFWTSQVSTAILSKTSQRRPKLSTNGAQLLGWKFCLHYLYLKHMPTYKNQDQMNSSKWKLPDAILQLETLPPKLWLFLFGTNRHHLSFSTMLQKLYHHQLDAIPASDIYKILIKLNYKTLEIGYDVNDFI